jgi:hypothetical protein
VKYCTSCNKLFNIYKLRVVAFFGIYLIIHARSKSFLGLGRLRLSRRARLCRPLERSDAAARKGGYEFSEADVVVGVPATLMALARAAVPEVS